MSARTKLSPDSAARQSAEDKPGGRPSETRTADRLVVDFAARLGLTAAEARVDTSTAAGTVVRAQGVKGLMRDGVAHLDPASFDSESGGGRYLLAHEMTHLAQRAERRQTGDRRPVSLAAAEREADAMGRRAAALLPLWLPQVLLPPGAMAADAGVGTAHDPKEAAPRERPESPTTLAERIAARAAPFPGTLKPGRDAIQNSLDGLVTDGDMNDVLRVLDAHAFVDAAAIIRSLNAEEQDSFVNELSDSHYRNYRRSVVAGYAAVAQAQADEFDDDNFDEFDFGAMEREEIVALDLVLDVLEKQRPRFAAELLHSDAGAAIRQRMLDPFGTPQPSRRPDGDRSSDDEQVLPELTEEENEQVRAAISALQDDPDEATARAVLDRLRPFAPLVEPERRPGATSADPDQLQLDEFGGALRTVPPKLRRAGQLLAKAGALDRLLEAVDKQDDALNPRYAGLFFALMAFRPVWANLAYVEDLLSTGFFNWVRDWEAEFSYRLLRALPLDAQYRFRQLEGGRYYRRLEEEINRDLIRSGVYVGIEVSRDEEGEFVSTVSNYAALFSQDAAGHGRLAPNIEHILEFADDRFGTPDWASELYRLLGKLAGVGAGAGAETDSLHQSDELRYVVRRLDTLGALATMINNLSDGFLFADERRPVTLEIFLARDPIHLEEHARELMSTNWNILTFWNLDTAVTDRDAYVAFQLIRALPPAEQAAFLRRDGGEAFQEIWNELHARMRKSRDMHLFVERDGGLNREDLRLQLAATEKKEDRWTAERRYELDALIRLAITFGDYEFVFRQSKARKAYQVGELQPIISRYRLYDLTPTSLRIEPAEDDLPTSILSQVSALQFLQPLGRGIVNTTGTLTNLLALFFESDLLIGPHGGGYRLDIETVLRLARHAADSTSIDTKRQAGEERGENENYADLWFDLPARQMHIDVPNLQIRGYTELFGEMRVETGPLSIAGLRLVAGYDDDGFSRPVQVDAHMDDLTVNSVGMTKPDSVTTFGQIRAHPLDVNARMEGANDAETRERPQGAWIPMPLLAPLFLGLLEVQSHFGRVTSKESYRNLRSLSVAFDRLDIFGLATDSGARLAALSITDFKLGIATSPDEYFRLQLEQAQRHRDALSDKEREGDVGKELNARIGRLRFQYRSAQWSEARRQELKRRYEADRDSLSAKELEELVSLERARALGVTIDVGKVELTGLESAVDVDSLTLQGITGSGESAAGLRILSAIGLPSLADPSVLATFRQRLDREERGDLPSEMDADITLKVAKTEARGVGFTYIPSPKVAGIMVEILGGLAEKQPEEQRYAEALASLRAALPGVRRYHELSEELQRRTLRPKEQREFGKLTRALKETFYVRTERIELEETEITANLGTGELGLKAKKLTVEDIHGLGVKIDSIEGEDVDLSLTLISRMLQGFFHGRRDGDFDLFSSAGIGAERLTAKGVDASLFGVSAKEIDIRGLDAHVSRGKGNTYRLDITRLDSLTLDNFQLRTTDQSLQAPGKTMLQSATMGVDITTVAERKPNGEEETRISKYHFESVKIGRLAYEAGETGPLIYEGPAPSFVQPKPPKPEEKTPPPPPRRMRVEVKQGALLGIFADGFTVDRTDRAAMQLSGRAGVAGIDSFQVAAIVREGFQAPDGRAAQTHAIEGKVTGGKASPSEEPKILGDAGPSANALEVTYVEGDMETLRLNDIDITDGLVVIGNNRAVIRRVDGLSGHLQFEGDTIHVHDLGLTNIEIAGLHWQTESGKLLEARGTASAQGVSLVGKITRKDGNLQALSVTTFRVDRLKAAHFLYHDERKGIRLELDNRGATKAGEPALDITRLVLTGLEWKSGQALPTSGKLEIGQLGALFDASYGKDLSAKGKLNATGLNLQFQRGDEVIAKVQDLDAKATLRKGKTEADIAVKDFRTGETGKEGSIRYRHGRGIDFDKLRIGSLSLSRLDMDGDSIRIAIPAPAPGGGGSTPSGEIELKDISLSAEIDFQQSEDEAAPPVQEIRITELLIPRIEAEGVAVTLKKVASGVTITLPAGKRASVENVRLTPAKGDKVFSIKTKFDKGTGKTDWLLKGLLNTGKVNVPSLLADLAGTLEAQATIAVPSIEGEFFGDGRYRIKLKQPSISALRADLNRVLPNAVLTLLPGTTGAPGTIGADEVNLTEKGLEIIAPHGGPFELKLPDQGVTIKVGKITGTPKIRVIYAEEVTGPQPPGPKVASNFVVAIDEAVFSDTKIVIDDLNALLSSGGGAGELETDDEAGSGSGTTGGAGSLQPSWASSLVRMSKDFAPLLDGADGRVDITLDYPRGTQTAIDLGINIPIAGGNADLRPMELALSNEVERVAEGDAWSGYLLYDKVRIVVDGSAVDVDLNELVYDTVFGTSSPTGWVTLVEFDLSNPPGSGSSPSPATPAAVPVKSLLRFNLLFPAPPAGGTPGGPLDLGLDINLSINNTAPFPYTFGTPGKTGGTAVLAPKSINALTVSGSLTDGTGTLNFGVNSAKLQRLNMKMAGGALSTGNITVESGDGPAVAGTLQLSGYTPGKLVADIVTIRVKNVDFRIPTMEKAP